MPYTEEIFNKKGGEYIMKNRSIFLFSTFLILFTRVSSAQGNNFSQLNHIIKVGNNFGEIGKGLQLDNGIPVSYLPDDIVVDNNENFFICDKFSKKIIKYDKELNPQYEIQIEDMNAMQKYIKRNGKEYPLTLDFNIHLRIDQSNNLYALISKDGLFYKMLKYDNSGKNDPSFIIGNELEGKIANTFFIEDQKIFVLTSPPNFFDKTYMNEGNVFIYTLSGEFLGKANYYIEDSKGNIYKQNNLNKKNKLWIDQYSSGQVKGLITNNSKVNKSLFGDLPDNTALRFLGTDKFDNLYFVDKNIEGITGKIFDFNKNEVKNIFVKQEIIKQYSNQFNLVIPHDPFILSPAGELYLITIKCNQGNDWFKNTNYSDVSLVILKLTKN